MREKYTKTALLFKDQVELLIFRGLQDPCIGLFKKTTGVLSMNIYALAV
jgi:hypothetical protein